MMKCDVIRDLIPMYTDKTASAETEETVREHLKTCRECRNFFASWKTYETKEADSENRRKLERAAAESGADITELEYKFASLSSKLKKRRLRNLLIAIAVAVSVLTYVTIDIVNTLKRKETR